VSQLWLRRLACYVCVGDTPCVPLAMSL